MMLFQKISNSIALKISRVLNLNNDRQEVIAYGAYLMLDSLLSIGMVMLFGAVFGVFFEALIISFASALLRKTSGGAHASTSIGCAVIGTVASVGFAYAIMRLRHYFTITNVTVYLLIALAFSFIAILKLAPKDSPNKPIVKETKIKELKNKSLVTLCIYNVICAAILLLCFFGKTKDLLHYIVLVCTGYLWQAFSLTSSGHYVAKIFELPLRYISFKGGENQ